MKRTTIALFALLPFATPALAKDEFTQGQHDMPATNGSSAQPAGKQRGQMILNHIRQSTSRAAMDERSSGHTTRQAENRSPVMNRTVLLTFAALSVSIAGCTHSSQPDDMHGMHTGQTSSMTHSQDASATDLHNTVCPVSGDAVGDSKLTEVYNGKVYHFCCEDCPAKFKANPDKYASAVAADPAKYGVK